MAPPSRASPSSSVMEAGASRSWPHSQGRASSRRQDGRSTRPGDVGSRRRRSPARSRSHDGRSRARHSRRETRRPGSRDHRSLRHGSHGRRNRGRRQVRRSARSRPWALSTAAPGKGNRRPRGRTAPPQAEIRVLRHAVRKTASPQSAWHLRRFPATPSRDRSPAREQDPDWLLRPPPASPRSGHRRLRLRPSAPSGSLEPSPGRDLGDGPSAQLDTGGRLLWPVRTGRPGALPLDPAKGKPLESNS